MKYALRIETTFVAGHYIHTVLESGRGVASSGQSVSDELVDLLKKANEAAWEDMPKGGRGLVGIIKFDTPKRLGEDPK